MKRTLMKRTLFLGFLLFSLLLCACGSESDNKGKNHTTAETDGHYDTAFTLDDTYKTALSDETVTAAETCAAIY